MVQSIAEEGSQLSPKSSKLNTNEVFEGYEKNKFRYAELETEVKHILNKELKEREIKIHSILSRIKEFESLIRKADIKSSTKPFEDITDIVGARVVCLFLSDIQKIGDCVKDCFDVLSEDDKINGDEDVNTFGYMSVHFIAKLKDSYNGPRYNHIKDLRFEIQVRTISMDAWANISHYLDYKSEKDIPSELKRDFHALSGLFYVADSHFEMFVKSSHESQLNKEHEVEKLLSTGDNEIDNERLDLDTLTAYLKQKIKDRYINNSKTTSLLLGELLESGYDTLSKLDNAINQTKEAFLAYENKYPPAVYDKEHGPIYQAAGVVRVSLSILDENYRKLAKNIDDISYADPEIVSLIRR